MSSSPAERYQARFEASGHPWPDLVLNNLAHLWIGPRRGDFAPELILGVQSHLERCKSSATKQDAITWIVIRLGRLPSDPTPATITLIEGRYEEGKEILERRAAAQPPPPPPSPAGGEAPPAFAQLSPAEQQAQQAAIAAARRNLSKKLGGTADAPTAQ